MDVEQAMALAREAGGPGAAGGTCAASVTGAGRGTGTGRDDPGTGKEEP